MAINKTTLLSQLTAMLEHGHDENIVFPFIFIDGKKYDTLTTDNNEVGILSRRNVVHSFAGTDY